MHYGGTLGGGVRPCAPGESDQLTGQPRSLRMNPRPLALALAFAIAIAGLTGCSTVREPSRARTAAPFEPTALIIADERGPLTADELAAHRPAIIQYLVNRGYLESPDALVDNPAVASRFIRVILSPGGSFRITEFTLGNRARHITTTSFIPGHSDDYGEYGRHGYHRHLSARPYREERNRPHEP